MGIDYFPNRVYLGSGGQGLVVDKMISEINKLGQAESDQARDKKKPEDF